MTEKCKIYKYKKKGVLFSGQGTLIFPLAGKNFFTATEFDILQVNFGSLSNFQVYGCTINIYK